MAGEVVQQCRACFKKLREISSSGTKGLADPELRNLRETARDTCLKALQLEYEKAQKDDIERKLWRFAFYLPIGEFRNRLASPSVNDQLKAKILVAYLKFLDDAVAYYQTLITNLTTTLDTATNTSTHVAYNSLPTANKANKVDTPTTDVTVTDTVSLQSALRTSLARCYICIGDLKRYSAAVSASSTNNEPTKKATEAATKDTTDKGGKGNAEGEKQTADIDINPASTSSSSPSIYSAARHAYAAAVDVDPRFGNGYNQLAVVDELEGDRIAAAFFYLRAQCALTPFPLGHQNVALLFGAAVTAENAAEATAAATATAAVVKKSRKEYKKTTTAQQQQQQRGSMPTSVLEKEISSKFLALSGCLYEKIDVDATPTRLTAAGNFLDELLNRIKQQTGSGGVAKCTRQVAQTFHSMPTSMRSAVEHRPLSLLLLITMLPLLLIQMFEESLTSADSSSYTASAAARGYAISYLLDISSRLLTTATKLRLGTKGPVGDAALTCPAFAPISVVLRWMVMREAHPALGSLNLMPGSKNGGDDEGGVTVMMENDDAAAAAPLSGASTLFNTLANVEKTVSGLNSNRIAFWKACSALCRLLPSTGAVNVEVKETEKDGKEEDMVLLPEDYLLTGFTPLLKCSFTYNQGTREDPIASKALAEILSSSLSSLPSSVSKYVWNESDPGKPGELRIRRICHDLQTLASYARTWLLKMNKNKNKISGGGGDAQITVLETENLIETLKEFIDTVADSIGLPNQEENPDKQDEEEEEEEEVILFAPLSATRKSNSAALLNEIASGDGGGGGGGGGISGRSSIPAPPGTGGDAAPAARIMNPAVQEATQMDLDLNLDLDRNRDNTIASVPSPAPAAQQIVGEEEEDAQAAMERTGYAMAATVLSSDDAELQGTQPVVNYPPNFNTNYNTGSGGGGGGDHQSVGLLGSLMFTGGAGGAPTAGYTRGDTSGNLLFSSWQQQPQHQQQLQQQQYNPLGVFSPPPSTLGLGSGGPPLPSSALLGGMVGQHQEPAEGLRAVLFGGNMHHQPQQQQQQQQPGAGGGGNLWG